MFRQTNDPPRKLTEQLARMNFALRAYTRVNQALIHSSDEPQLLQNVVDTLIQVGEYGLAWIGFPEDNPQRTVRVVACSGQSREYLDGLHVTWSDGPLGNGPAGRALRGEGISVALDMLDDANCTPWQEKASQFHLRSTACFPLTIGARVAGVLAVYTTREHEITVEEIDLLAELAGDLSYGLTALRARKEAADEHAARELLEEQLRRAQKLEAVGRLAGAIAHEFNNLLTIISGQTELLALDLEGKKLERVQKVSHSVRRAAELTRQLSAFSQQKPRNPQATTINKLLESTRAETARLTAGKLEVSVTTSEDPWPVLLDKQQIEQVIKLMVATATEVLPRGGCLHIQGANCTLAGDPGRDGEILPEGRYVYLCMADAAGKVNFAEMPRPVEPFTTRPAAKGTGLGLAIAYELVKENKGFICVSTGQQSGTCYRVYFPALEDAAALATPQVEAATPIETANFLFVEDLPEVRRALAELKLLTQRVQ